jgi:hypothetical protein
MRPVIRSGIVLWAIGICGCHREPWTVLNGAEAVALRQPCSRPFPDELQGQWAPRKEDVALAESEIGRAVDAAFARLKTDRPPYRPSSYRRQYAGFWRRERRVLYVNGIASGLTDDRWRSRAASMCDGGTQSYGAVFDLDRRSFDSFYFNGAFSGRLPGGGW